MLEKLSDINKERIATAATIIWGFCVSVASAVKRDRLYTGWNVHARDFGDFTKEQIEKLQEREREAFRHAKAKRRSQGQ